VTWCADTTLVTATDRATNFTEQPFAVVRDTTPPTFTLSLAVEDGALPVAWGATDDASGVACYDLDARIEDGPWQRVLTNTQAAAYLPTCPLFHLPRHGHGQRGEPGQRRDLRARRACA